MSIEKWRVVRVNGQLGGSCEFVTIQFEDFHVLDYRTDWRSAYRDLVGAEKEWEKGAIGDLLGKWHEGRPPLEE